VNDLHIITSYTFIHNKLSASRACRARRVETWRAKWNLGYILQYQTKWYLALIRHGTFIASYLKIIWLGI